MPHVTPLPLEATGDLRPMLEQFRAQAGFIPNSLLTMAHRPEILRAYMQLGQAVMLSGSVDLRLKRLVALVASTAAGCRYCQAHMATFSAVLGVPAAELGSVWQFEFDAAFGEAERAALRLARDAAQVPNAVTEEHFAALRRHFSDAQILELVGVIAMFGFLNRWNDTLATELEPPALAAAADTLGRKGWSPGKHTGRAAE